VSSESDQHACITIAGCIRKEDLQFLQPSCICLHLWYSCLQANMTLTQQNNTGILNAAAGPPKGIAKLLTVSESGRMRSPPLVEKFGVPRRTCCRTGSPSPSMASCSALSACSMRSAAVSVTLCVGFLHPLPHPVWVAYTPCLTLCGFYTPTTSPCVGSKHPLPQLTDPAALQDRCKSPV